MKYKTTKKAVNEGYANRICVSYCALQTLLAYESETAYTVRREGWAADIYDFGNTAIITGYAPFGNIRPGYDVCRRYEKQADAIRYNYDLSYEDQKNQLRQLINEFIKEVTKQ